MRNLVAGALVVACVACGGSSDDWAEDSDGPLTNVHCACHVVVTDCDGYWIGNACEEDGFSWDRFDATRLCEAIAREIGAHVQRCTCDCAEYPRDGCQAPRELTLDPDLCQDPPG